VHSRAADAAHLDVTPLGVRTQLARAHVLDHALAQRADSIIEIDQKPLQAALTGLYTKVLTDSHSRHLVDSIQKDQ
jgi:hypothetical protein